MNEQREIIKTFSEMAPRYERLMNNELNRFWGINYRDFVSRLLSDIKTEEGEVILDIATGTGYIPTYLSENKNYFRQIVGLDLTFDMLLCGKGLSKPNPLSEKIKYLCASAHKMPFQESSFDQTICCLATHHMNAPDLLSNIHRSLKPGGKIHIADAGGSSYWKNFVIRFLIKTAAFLYFLVTENYSRAVAESAAIGNIYTAEEWEDLIKKQGFENIRIHHLKSKRFWTPDPIIIKANKN